MEVPPHLRMIYARFTGLITSRRNDVGYIDVSSPTIDIYEIHKRVVHAHLTNLLLTIMLYIRKKHTHTLRQLAPTQDNRVRGHEKLTWAIRASMVIQTFSEKATPFLNTLRVLYAQRAPEREIETVVFDLRTCLRQELGKVLENSVLFN